MGDRLANLRAAIDALNARGVCNAAESSVYETEPQLLSEQPWFLNMVVACRWNDTPQSLLNAIQQVEETGGRVRTVKNGPRLIDIDILLFDKQVIETPGLTVPHPHLRSRRFVLLPLLEIAPDLTHPMTGRPLMDDLGATADQAIRLYH